jgi:hypothetical protein
MSLQDALDHARISGDLHLNNIKMDPDDAYWLSENIPASIHSVYFQNSPLDATTVTSLGTEAIMNSLAARSILPNGLSSLRFEYFDGFHYALEVFDQCGLHKLLKQEDCSIMRLSIVCGKATAFYNSPASNLEKALRANTSLTSLKLARCDCPIDSICIALSESKCDLRELSFSQPPVGVYMESLVKLLKSKNIETLELHRLEMNSKQVSSLFSVLTSKKCVQTLKALNCGILSESCVHIAKLVSVSSTLTALDLSGNKLTGAGALEIIKAFSESKDSPLERLNLENTGIGDKSLKVLTKCVNRFCSLNLSKNRFTAPVVQLFKNSICHSGGASNLVELDESLLDEDVAKVLQSNHQKQSVHTIISLKKKVQVSSGDIVDVMKLILKFFYN